MFYYVSTRPYDTCHHHIQTLLYVSAPSNYENTPIQIYCKFYKNKKKKFSDKKNSDNFHISAQNIDCGYSLEPPLPGGSNKYP